MFELSIDIMLIILILCVIILIAYWIVQGNKKEALGLLNMFSGGSEPEKFTTLKMDDNWLDLVQDGEKNIDVRIKSKSTDKFEKDSHISYFSENRNVLVKVVKKIEYDNLDSLLDKEKLDNIFPSQGKDKKITKEEARLMFLKKDQGGKGYYTEEDFSKPFVAIHIKAIVPGK